MKQNMIQAAVLAAVVTFAGQALAQTTNSGGPTPGSDTYSTPGKTANPVAGDGSNSGTPSSSSHYKAKTHHKSHPKKTTTSTDTTTTDETK